MNVVVEKCQCGAVIALDNATYEKNRAILSEWRTHHYGHRQEQKERDESRTGSTPIVPFLPVQSNDGPYEDEAYAAGWEMGRIDAALAEGITSLDAWIRTPNYGQLDLIAMRRGARIINAEGGGEGWTLVTVKRVTS